MSNNEFQRLPDDAPTSPGGTRYSGAAGSSSSGASSSRKTDEEIAAELQRQFDLEEAQLRAQRTAQQQVQPQPSQPPATVGSHALQPVAPSLVVPSMGGAAGSWALRPGAIAFQNFFPQQLGPNHFESIEGVMDRVNAWAAHNSIPVMNIETLMLPAQQLGNQPYYVASQSSPWFQVFRVWYRIPTPPHAQQGSRGAPTSSTPGTGPNPVMYDVHPRLEEAPPAGQQQRRENSY
jgi:hypothetical protein